MFCHHNMAICNGTFFIVSSVICTAVNQNHQKDQATFDFLQQQNSTEGSGLSEYDAMHCDVA